MNKKILSIFALIMALSFAVSCSNDTTNPDKTEDKEFTVADVQSIIQSLKSVSVGTNPTGTVDFTSVTLGKDGNVAADAVSGTASTGLVGSEVVTSLQTTIQALKIEGVSSIAVTGTISSGPTGKVTIKITAAKGYSFKGFDNSVVSSGVLTITLTLTGKDASGAQAFQ